MECLRCCRYSSHLSAVCLEHAISFYFEKIDPEAQVAQVAQVAQELANPANQPACQLEMGTAWQSGEKPMVASKENVDSALGQDTDVCSEEVAGGVKEAVVDDHYNATTEP